MQGLKGLVRWLGLHGMAVAVVCLGFVIATGWAVLRPGPIWHRSLPDFSRIENGSQRKAAFFTFLHPYIDESNAGVLASRARLAGIRRQWRGGPLGRRHLYWLHQMGAAAGMELDRFDQPTEAQLQELSLRIDIIPPSLALAQAALESGWGTSRFAREGNNLFGMWCYEPGCGMIPRHRPAGATYEVTSYYSPRESFDAYIRNLNSNPAYESLRLLREQSRRDGESPTGLDLADGLYRYSQEQWAYVGKVKGLIRSNELTLYDQ